jgi:K(+)-stimulated pyrophosphate-energized sodium pump
LLGVATGASLVALAMRTGGGIVAEASEAALRLLRGGQAALATEGAGRAQVGDDVSGSSSPSGDQRDPAVAVALAGETLQTAAGTAAELFVATELAFLASIVLGVAAFRHLSPGRVAAALLIPIVVRAVGALASIVGIVIATPGGREEPRTRDLVRGFLLSVVIAGVGSVVAALVLARDLRPALALAAGLGLAAAVTAFYGFGRGERLAESGSRLPLVGPFGASSGASGPASSASFLMTLAGAVIAAAVIGRGELPMALYAVSLTGVGMLSVIVAATSLGVFAPVAEGAGSVASMAGGLGERADVVLGILTDEGRATRLVVEAFVTGAAGLAVVGLLGLAINPETAASTAGFADRAPRLLVGLLLGTFIPLLAGSLTTGTLARSAAELVFQVRVQLRDHPGILAGREKPDLDRLGAVSAGRAFLELGAPAVLAAIGPVALGFGLGPDALAVAVAGALITTPMAALVVPRDPLAPGARCPALTPVVEVMAVSSLLLGQSIRMAAGRPWLEGSLTVAASLAIVLVLAWWRGRRVDAPWPWGEGSGAR